jgi:hypothetical protein
MGYSITIRGKRGRCDPPKAVDSRDIGRLFLGDEDYFEIFLRLIVGGSGHILTSV